MSFVSFFGVKFCIFFGNCHVSLGSSFFPAACRFLSFWSRNVKSFWQKQRFGWAWARKTATDFSFRGNTRNTFLTHTRFQARWWWELETQTSSLAILVFSWGNTHDACSHVFLETHPGCRDFWAPCVSMWNHIFNTYAFTIIFMYLCENTNSFTCSGIVKSRNACAFPCFPL